MDVLAIDPGKNLGGALKFAGRDPIAFTLYDPTPRQLYEAFRWAQRFAGGRKLRLVTEDQHLARGAKANPHAMLEVARSAERALAVGALVGMRCEQVAVSTWREPVIKPVDRDAGDKKKRTRIAVSRLWPRVWLYKLAVGDGVEPVQVESVDLPQDPIDALGMVRWATME